MSPTAVTFDWRGTQDTLFYSADTSWASSVVAVVPSPAPFSSAGPFKEAQVTGLTIGSSYNYKIGFNGTRGHRFHAAPARGSSDFTICVQGDIGDTTSYSQVGGVQTLTMNQSPAFVLMLVTLAMKWP